MLECFLLCAGIFMLSVAALFGLAIYQIIKELCE